MNPRSPFTVPCGAPDDDQGRRALPLFGCRAKGVAARQAAIAQALVSHRIRNTCGIGLKPLRFVGSIPWMGIARGLRGNDDDALRVTCYSNSLISSMRFQVWPGPRLRMVAPSSSIEIGSTTRV